MAVGDPEIQGRRRVSSAFGHAPVEPGVLFVLSFVRAPVGALTWLCLLFLWISLGNSLKNILNISCRPLVHVFEILFWKAIVLDRYCLGKATARYRGPF